MGYQHTVDSRVWRFADLKTLLAKASPPRSGDVLAGVAAETPVERTAARMALAELPLSRFLEEPVVPAETDEVTRLIYESHNADAAETVAHLTVGDFRDWLLSDHADEATLSAVRSGLTPEMAAAVSKLMRNQDLISVARKCRVVTRFRNTLGLPGTLAMRLQPNHPTDDPRGILAGILDGLMYGCGDAVIGVNPAGDDMATLALLLQTLDDVLQRFAIPTQACVLAHVSSQIEAINAGLPVDLVFQSIGGTETTNRSFGINLAMLREAHEAALATQRGTVGNQVMYFETGQGSALSANGHHGVDQQTCEARAYGVARAFDPLICNTVVGFIGPEYLQDGKQILRAGLEDHFCGCRRRRHGHPDDAPGHGGRDIPDRCAWRG
jgi:ethanolamine ammonia-lyase large subunit